MSRGRNLFTRLRLNPKPVLIRTQSKPKLGTAQDPTLRQKPISGNSYKKVSDDE